MTAAADCPVCSAISWEALPEHLRAAAVDECLGPDFHLSVEHLLRDLLGPLMPVDDMHVFNILYRETVR